MEPWVALARHLAMTTDLTEDEIEWVHRALAQARATRQSQTNLNLKPGAGGEGE